MIKELYIEKFRQLESLTIPVAPKLTAIAGQNGIGKSSILGLIGHVFNFDDTPTLDKKSFKAVFSEVFRFSYPSFDKPGEHRYKIALIDGSEKNVNSSERSEKGVIKGLRLNVGEKKAGEGNIIYPVIYLGLKRLFPLAAEDEKNIKQDNTTGLNQDDIGIYKTLHNEILLLDGSITPERVTSKNKNFFGATSQKYDSLGNSAGQDNVGQIITALLSFKKLKELQQDQYKGGILLIDEIDATLFPAAQVKLIEKLLFWSGKLNLQIIFTTHSLEILEKLLIKQEYKNHCNVCYLHNASGKVELAKEASIIKTISDLKAEVPQIHTPKIEKIDLYLEDAEAKLFLNNILKPEIKKKIKIQDATSGGENLLHFATRKYPAFQTSIILLDGDKKKSLGTSKPKNVILLPGDERPEDIFFKFLATLEPSDKFWDGFGGYTKQICFKDTKEIGDRSKMKNWFNSQLPHWGKSAKKLFDRWKLENTEEVEQFNTEFEKILNKLLS